MRENLERVRGKIAAAAKRAGRDPASVRLVAVTKGVSIQNIEEAIAAGVTEIGENRVQEAQEKQSAVGRAVRWHMVGHLQRNKAKFAAELFDMIHSVDSLELAVALDERTQKRDKPLEVLLQVNVSGEATKSGCRPEEAEQLAEAMAKSKNLRFKGLMTMAPFGENPEEARPHFRKLRELRDKLDSTLDLSMGMSHDFEVAIEEGATIVRIGTAIFGERS